MDLSTLPTSGDRLFQKSSSRNSRPDLEGSWLAFSQSYKRAGDELVTARPPDASDVQVYPIIFLYRHFIELELKSVAALDCVLDSVRVVWDEDEEDYIPAAPSDEATAREKIEELLRTHDLISLMSACKDACDKGGLMKGDFVGIFAAFESCIRELADHDPGSYAFRYPTDKKLGPNLTRLAGINLQQLRATVHKLGRFTVVMRHAIQQRIDWATDDTTWTDEDQLLDRKDILGIDELEAQSEQAE
jgi:hypothetical protein